MSYRQVLHVLKLATKTVDFACDHKQKGSQPHRKSKKKRIQKTRFHYFTSFLFLVNNRQIITAEVWVVEPLNQ